MQVEVPESVIDAMREALTPILDWLIEERVEQRRPLLLSVTQVAEELSCSRASVYGLIHGGHLEAVQTGRTYRVATATLREYVEELVKPSYQREVVSARTKPSPASRRVGRADRARSGVVPAAAVVPATRPPRPPRPRKEKKPSKKEMADRRCSIAEFAEQWWDIESAIALLESSGVALTEGFDAESTFRYGDLVEWMEGHHELFERWLERFDPILKRSEHGESQ